MANAISGFLMLRWILGLMIMGVVAFGVISGYDFSFFGVFRILK